MGWLDGLAQLVGGAAHDVQNAVGGVAQGVENAVQGQPQQAPQIPQGQGGSYPGPPQEPPLQQLPIQQLMAPMPRLKATPGQNSSFAGHPTNGAQPQYSPGLGGAPIPDRPDRLGPSLQELGTIDSINHATGSPYGDYTLGQGVIPSFPSPQNAQGYINSSVGGPYQQISRGR